MDDQSKSFNLIMRVLKHQAREVYDEDPGQSLLEKAHECGWRFDDSKDDLCEKRADLVMSLKSELDVLVLLLAVTLHPEKDPYKVAEHWDGKWKGSNNFSIARNPSLSHLTDFYDDISELYSAIDRFHSTPEWIKDIPWEKNEELTEVKTSLHRMADSLADIADVLAGNNFEWQRVITYLQDSKAEEMLENMHIAGTYTGGLSSQQQTFLEQIKTGEIHIGERLAFYKEIAEDALQQTSDHILPAVENAITKTEELKRGREGGGRV